MFILGRRFIVYTTHIYFSAWALSILYIQHSWKARGWHHRVSAAAGSYIQKHTYEYTRQTKRFPGLSKSETSHPSIKIFVTNDPFLDRHRRRSTSSPRFIQAWQRDHDPFYDAYELLIGQSMKPFSARVGRWYITEPTVAIDAFYSEYSTDNAIMF